MMMKKDNIEKTEVRHADKKSPAAVSAVEAKMTASQEKLSGVDYDQVEPLQRKRLLKFVNHFVLQMANFLSNFSQTCDIKLMSISKKLNDLETSLVLLENKLESVPSLKKSMPEQETNATESVSQTEDVNEKVIEVIEESQIDESLVAPFKKMLQVGVPEQAVRQKMKIQGLDAALLFS